MKQFEAGKIYFANDYADSDGVREYMFRIVSRTAKTVSIEWIICGRPEPARRRKVFVDKYGDEYCYPFGNQYAINVFLKAA